MEDIYVINHIKELCQQKGWSKYKLAKKSGIPHSSLNTMLNKQHIPSMNNLIKICNGFGITLSQFFSDTESLTDEQSEILYLWNSLDDHSKQLAKVYLYGLSKKQIPLPSLQENHKE